VPSEAIVFGPVRHNLLRWLAFGSIILISIFLRLNSDLGRDLWEDEIIAAAHAEQPFWRLPVEVARFDVHPFLYFMQLHAWTLVGDSDIWLRLNSVFWNCIAVVSIFIVCLCLYGTKPAWIAASLFAVSAPVVWMAQEVRPYSWLYCLLIWAFYFAERLSRSNYMRSGDRLLTVCLCLGIIYSHALGFLAVFLGGMFALGRLVELRLTRHAFVSWGLLFGFCAVAAIPPILVDLFRDANFANNNGPLANLLDWIPRLLLPQGNSAPAVMFAGTVYLSLIIMGLRLTETRLMTLIYLVMPIFIALILSALSAPIFKLNVFTTFITPFFIIVLARVLGRLPDPHRWLAAGTVGLLFTAFSMLFFLNRTPTTGFRAATEFIRSSAKPGDVVYAPQQSMFWGMARYMGTDRRGWQLQIAPSLTDQWRRVYDRLGSRLVSWFELEPQTQVLATQSGLSLIVGNASVGIASQAHRVWLVTYQRADLPLDFPPPNIGGLRPALVKSIGFLHVELYQ
jgi:mannosyltransferase